MLRALLGLSVLAAAPTLDDPLDQIFECTCIPGAETKGAPHWSFSVNLSFFEGDCSDYNGEQPIGQPPTGCEPDGLNCVILGSVTTIGTHQGVLHRKRFDIDEELPCANGLIVDITPPSYDGDNNATIALRCSGCTVVFGT